MNHHEGNTKYRGQKLAISRELRVTATTWIDGKPLEHAVNMRVVDADHRAFVEGVNRLRPMVAAAEAKARGDDIAVPADPAIDRAEARKEELLRYQEQILADAKAEQAIASKMLNESNPLWGMF